MKTYCMSIVFFLLFASVQQPVLANGSPVVREHILIQLQQAQTFINNNEYQQSLALLNQLNDTNLSSYERSQVYRSLAFHFYNLDQSNQAIIYYQKILQLQDLPEYTSNETLYSLSQLYFSIEKYTAANESLAMWFANNPNPGEEAYELHGQILYQLKHYNLAIDALETAVKIHKASDKLPKQNWLQMLQAMYYELGQLQSTIDVIKLLVNYYPQKTYWLQLAGLYAEQGAHNQQLLVLDAAYAQGLLDKPDELKTLAYLYIEHKTPYAAAKVLQASIEQGHIETSEKNLTFLASALRLAQETKQAIKVMALAADLSKHGDLYAELAQLYLLDVQFDAAIKASRQAIDRGGLKKPGNVHITLGIALLKTARYGAAQSAFDQAKQDPTAEKLASQWQIHLDNSQILSSTLN